MSHVWILLLRRIAQFTSVSMMAQFAAAAGLPINLALAAIRTKGARHV